MPSPLTHRLLHPVRHKKATTSTRQSAMGNGYVVGGYTDDDWNRDCQGLPMPFVPLAAVAVLFGDVFDGHRQQGDPASVSLLTPHAGGRLDPPPLWVVHGRSAFNRACKAPWGQEEWAIVLLLPSRPTPDADAIPVSEVVRPDKVPHDPHVAVPWVREGGAVE